MALEFNELLGQPFADPIKEELEKRRSLNQRYETSPTLHNPYFNLRRIEKLTNQKEIDREITQKENIKFWELNKLSKQGLKDIKEKIDNGGNAKAPMGITDVSIEIKDYTFHSVEVNFLIPDINDWEAFKETWLVFGAPVEYEFGRKSLVDIEDNEDITPEKEIREGIIANFSWNLGEQKRTVVGSLTIYSSTYIELTKMAHSAKYDGVDIASDFKSALRQIQMKDSTFENIKDIHGTSDSPNIGIPDFTQVDENSEVQQDFLNKSTYFYAIMNKNEYEDRFEKMRESRNDQNVVFTRGGNQFFLNDEEGRLNIIPFGIEIINTDRQDIIEEFQNRLEQEEESEFEEEPQPEDYEWDIDNIQQHVNYVKMSTPFLYSDGSRATNFKEWIDDEEDENRLPDYISRYVDPSSIISLDGGFESYGQDYLEWHSSQQFQKQLDNQANNVSNTDIQKYALGELNLSNSTQNEFDSDVYFYVSIKFVNDILNGIIKKNNTLYLGEEPLLSIDLTDIKIRDLSFLGLGSSEPDKVIINPWNKKYSKNPNSNDNNNPNYREFILDRKGEYDLFEDVFISAPHLMDIAQNSDSPLEFMENIINEIESATNGLLQLKKVEKYRGNKNKVIGKKLTYFDSSTFLDKKNDDIEYYTFNLFDYREKLRDVDVNSDLSDDFAQYAYFESLGKIYSSDNLFYYNNTYYNNDGTINNELATLNTNVLTEKEKEKIRDKYDIEKNEDSGFLLFEDLMDSPEFTIDDEINKYMKNGQHLIQSYNTLFNNLLESNKQRLSDHLQSRNTTNFERDQTISLLTFIEAYFSVLTDVYHLKYNPFEKKDATTTIPLKVDISLDGIACILTGQTFKIDLSSFPMAYNISNTTPLFVVSTLSHSITENNDWETTIGGFLYIPASAQQDAIYESSSLKELIDSKNARLEMIKEIFINNIISILNE